MPFTLVDEKLIRKHRALPIHRRGNRLFLAVSDPTNDRALEEIRFNTGMATDAILVEEDKLAGHRSGDRCPGHDHDGPHGHGPGQPRHRQRGR
jgi:type II secretory ATPase GspE/PulE/Tfp pilus assembly ATPase PilB-like protein